MCLQFLAPKKIKGGSTARLGLGALGRTASSVGKPLGKSPDHVIGTSIDVHQGLKSSNSLRALAPSFIHCLLAFVLIISNYTLLL